MMMQTEKRNIIKYLPINNADMQWGICISGIGHQQVEAECVYPVKGHPIGYTFNPDRGRTIDEYAMVYITKGEGLFISAAAGEKKIVQGDAFFIHPGQWHSYRPNPKTGWVEYWTTFRVTHFESLLTSLISNSHPILHVGMNEQIVKLFQEMLDYAQAQRIGFQQVLSGVTLHIFGLMYTISKNQIFEEKDTKTIQEACVMMYESIYEKVKPEDVAQSLNMGYSSFRKLFKQYTGFAPHQYMLQLKLEKIKELLGSSDLSIQEIATIMNFESADYFSFFFRSKTGINPLLYRKNIEQQRAQAKQQKT